MIMKTRKNMRKNMRTNMTTKMRTKLRKKTRKKMKAGRKAWTQAVTETEVSVGFPPADSLSPHIYPEPRDAENPRFLRSGVFHSEEEAA
jgi:hypothetical protein